MLIGMRKIALSIALLGAIAAAQSDFVKPGSIGSPAAPTASCKFEGTNRPPITCWVEQKILFLPAPTSLQRYGYQSFKGGSGSYGQVTYKEGAGRVATVTKVTSGKYGGFDLEVKMDDNGQVYTARASYSDPAEATLDGVALLSELQAARTALKGKDVWISTKYLGQYDDSTGEVSSLKIPRFQKVHVQDVVAGWYNHEPVRLIVKTASNSIGFVDVAFKGYNSGSLWSIYAFSKNVSLVDPRTVYNWKPEVWKALENDTIIPGMTMEQVAYAFPWARSVTKSTTESGTIESWSYKDFGTVTFVNGIVKSFTR